MAALGIQDFDHVRWIKTPEELGMSSRGDIGTLTNSAAALTAISPSGEPKRPMAEV